MMTNHMSLLTSLWPRERRPRICTVIRPERKLACRNLQRY